MQPSRPHQLSTPYIIFLVIAAAAPLASMIGNLPIAIERGTGPYVPIAFLIAGAILIAFTAGYAFIGRRVVSTGAFYTYVAEGLGKPLGVGTAYAAILSYTSFTFGLAAACGYFDAQVFLAVGLHVSWQICTAASVLLTGFLNSRSMDVSSRLLAVIITVETAVLVVFDASVILVKGAAAFPLASFAPTGWIAPGTGVSLMTAFTCFVGFESGALYSKEAADPVRSIPLASYVSVLLIGIFYLLTAWIAIGAIGPDATKTRAMTHGGTLILDLIHQYDGEVAADIAGVLLCVSMLATYIAIHAAASRYVFALAREGLLPRLLARFDEARNDHLHGRHRLDPHRPLRRDHSGPDRHRHPRHHRAAGRRRHRNRLLHPPPPRRSRPYHPPRLAPRRPRPDRRGQHRHRQFHAPLNRQHPIRRLAPHHLPDRADHRPNLQPLAPPHPPRAICRIGTGGTSGRCQRGVVFKVPAGEFRISRFSRVTSMSLSAGNSLCCANLGRLNQSDFDL